jgi:hypothetical protein
MRLAGFALLGCLALLGRGAAAQVVLESATLGATGQIGGTSVTAQQFVGWRFQVAQRFAVAEVGGHLLGFIDPGSSGPIFAALIRLAAPQALPAGAPFLPAEIMASSTFMPPFPSDEILVSMQVTLDPGSYALVFGSGLFEATGGGALPNSFDQIDIPPTTIDSYIFYGIPQPAQPPIWRAALASQMRFVVVGDADGDGDGIGNAFDNCPFFASPDLSDSDGDGRGDPCECGDQTGDGRTTVADLVAINAAIFDPGQVTPLCDANGDDLCNVLDIVAANLEIFSPGNTSTCARQPIPGP